MTLLGDFLRSFGRRRAIRNYARRLPRLLIRDYGYSRTYTPRQVRRTIERSGLNVSHACYAIAMFSDRDGFNRFHDEIGEPCSYDSMRAQIAGCHFGGNVDFSTGDVFALSFDATVDSGHGVSHDGGGGGGGEGGGGH